MTSQNLKIKQLLDQIDVLLEKTPPRLPWVMAGDVDQQRKILEETRDYLRTLEPQITAREGYITPPALSGYSAPTIDTGATESAQQVLQAVLQEMNYLRSSVMQTMRSDIDALQQQRDALAQDVRFLEAQRQQYMVPQQQMNQQLISDFLQSLMGRLQENLTEQVAQMMLNMQLEAGGNRSLPGEPPETALPGSTTDHQGLLLPSQRLEHIQRVQAQSDQLLLKLDSTLKVIFESLHQNLQGYEESLGQGLDKMHRLGQQGEAMFAALVNRLAQQLGRDASAYLQSSLESSAWEAAPFLPPDVPLTRLDQSDGVTESQIDYLLNQLNRPQGQPTTGAGLPVDLSQLELETESPIFDLPDDGQLTLFQDESEDQNSGDLTLVQSEEPPLLSEPDAIAELDAAFDLLNQFTDRPAESPETDVSLSDAIAPVETPESLYGEVDLYESMFGPSSADEPESQSIEVSPTEAANPNAKETAIAPEDDAAPYLTDEAFPHEFEEALFEGLVDPAAQSDLATAELEEEIPVAASSLFGELDDDLEAEGWQEIQDDGLETAALFDAEPKEPVETISSLTELIPTEVDARQREHELGAVAEGSDETLLDEGYQAAAPNEDLLEADQPIDSTPLDLALDPNTINQLDADLLNLEGPEREEWELSDFDVTAPPAEPSAVEPSQPTLDTPTEEVLAGYFNGYEPGDDELALPQSPPDDDDLFLIDEAELSSILAEDPIEAEELESLQADDEAFEIPAVTVEDESALSSDDALRAILAEESDWAQFDDLPSTERGQDSANEVAIPEVDAMLPAPIEQQDSEALFSSVDASIDALPNIYSPDDLEMPYDEADEEATDSEFGPYHVVEDEDEDEAAIAHSSPSLPPDMTGDATVQDLFGQPDFDESPEPNPSYHTTEETSYPVTLDSFSDSFDEPDITSQAHLDEYEVVGNSYAGLPSNELSMDEDSLNGLFDAAAEEPFNLEDELDVEPDQPQPSGTSPAEPSIDDLFATDDPNDLFEVDALIEQIDQEDDNIFTLEDWGSVFESLPNREPDVYPVPGPGNKEVPNGLIPEGQFREAADQAETPEKKSL